MHLQEKETLPLPEASPATEPTPATEDQALQADQPEAPVVQEAQEAPQAEALSEALQDSVQALLLQATQIPLLFQDQNKQEVAAAMEVAAVQVLELLMEV